MLDIVQVTGVNNQAYPTSLWPDYISIIIAAVAFLFSFISFIMVKRTKKFELTNLHYNKILNWYSTTIHILTELRLSTIEDNESKKKMFSRLSAQIEIGRFYFPNIIDDDHSKDNPAAYKGRRNFILDILVFSYDMFNNNKDISHPKHVAYLQNLFTSYIFQELDPRKHNKRIRQNTKHSFPVHITINQFIEQKPESFDEFFSF